MMLTKLLRVEKEDTLLVRGPARIEPKGEIYILGMNLAEGDEVVVREHKIMPVESARGAEVVLHLGSGSGYSYEKGYGAKLWAKELSRVVPNLDESKRVMVVGETDSGKSTLTTLISNLLMGMGMYPHVIDADVGQGDLAPPGCIGAKRLRQKITDLRDLEADRYRFVGLISPNGWEELVLDEIEGLLSEGPEIVNTDGYVKGKGLEYKLELARRIDPDVILLLSDEKLSGFEDRTVRLRSVPFGKGIPGRIERRVSQYSKFLKDAKVRRERLDAKRLWLLGHGFRHDGEWVCGDWRLALSNLTYGAIIVRKEERLIELGMKDMAGMFVGLGHEEVEGFGMIRWARGRDASILTPVEEFDTISLGAIRLSRMLDKERNLKVLLY